MAITMQETEIKPGYKLTEVGVIPEEWEVFSLGNLIDYTKGFAFKSYDYQDEGVQIIRVSDTTFDSIKNIHAIYIDTTKAAVYSKWALKEYDLIVSTVGSKPPMYDSLVGKVVIVEKSYEGSLLNQNAVLLRSKQRENYKQQILLYNLRTNRYLKYIESVFRGNANQASITIKDLFDFQLALPCKEEEQRAIATALSDVDALITSLDNLIAKKRDIKQATMQQLLTGKTRLPGFDGEWETFRIADKSTLKARIGWQGLTTAEYLQDGDYYLVTGTDFDSGKISWHSCHFVDVNRYNQDKNIQLRLDDVLLTKDGTIGKVAYVSHLPGPTTLNSGVFVVRPKSDIYHSLYLYYVLSSSIFDTFLKQLQAGSTISHLYQKDFVSFEFLAPSSKEEQIAIATILSDMDAEIAALEEKRDKTRALKQGMMQELLTGKTRLI